MDHILNLIKEQQVNNTPTPPKIDEKAQIVVQPRFGSSLVLRYRKVDAAEKACAKLTKAWTGGDGHVAVASDMFNSIIDTSEVVFISLVVHEKRMKFVPFQ